MICTYLVNKKLRPLQHILIAKIIGVEIILAAKHNDATSSAPSSRYLNAPSRIPTEAVLVLEAGLLDQVAKCVLAVRVISGVKQLLRTRDETCIGL